MNDTKRKVLCLLAQLFAIPGFVFIVIQSLCRLFFTHFG